MMSARHFLSLMDCTPEELVSVIRRGIELKDLRNRGVLFEPLKNRVLGMIFEKSSTRTRMEQVFSNLISNAVHHGDRHSPIKVALTVTQDTCVFSVHNHGNPIPTDVQPFIFNPMGRFSQRSVIEHGPTEGLGLGLFIASEIVASHQGLIEVESDSQSGTVFRVTVPLDGA